MEIMDVINTRDIQMLATYSADEIANAINGYRYSTFEVGIFFNQFRSDFPILWTSVEAKVTNKAILRRFEKIRNSGQSNKTVLDARTDLTGGPDNTFKGKIENGVIFRMDKEGAWFEIGVTK